MGYLLKGQLEVTSPQPPRLTAQAVLSDQDGDGFAPIVQTVAVQASAWWNDSAALAGEAVCSFFLLD